MMVTIGNTCRFSVIHFILALFFISTSAFAQTFNVPAQGDVVGSVKTAVVKAGDSLPQIARDYDMGYTELEEANPNIDPDHLNPGTVVVIPSQFILPNTPRNGIVINLAEMRLYFYTNGGRTVHTYPIGIGREGEDTPIGVLKIIQHIPNPTWYSPESIRIARAKEGIDIPKVVPPGPDNPLGKFAMRLSKPTYLIHGTNDPLGGIGRRSSSGCIRLYPEDIERLFSMVPNGANVYIINEPYKAGWLAGELYLESHVPLTDKDADTPAPKDAERIKTVVRLAIKDKQAMVEWDKAMDISDETQGLPQPIGRVASRPLADSGMASSNVSG
ncbi:MAG TPA: L,D-transpeptidase family protein [Gammaproteobacteria bacterium]|nr:L,D-transpeptidase family protein [Gammaproteobacteria bacterium]